MQSRMPKNKSFSTAARHTLMSKSPKFLSSLRKNIRHDFSLQDLLLNYRPSLLALALRIDLS